MKKISRFFFYYTFILLNGLTVVSLFFLGSPYNLLYGVVLVPSLLFFWIKITDPLHATESSWSARLVIAIAVVSSLLIFGFYLRNDLYQKASIVEGQLAMEKSNSASQMASISAELALLRQQLNQQTEAEPVASSEPKIVDQQVIDLLNSIETTDKNDSQQPTILGEVRLKGKAESNVYESKSNSSKIIGIAEVNTSYDYFKLEDTWYYLEISEGRRGWIESDKVYITD